MLSEHSVSVSCVIRAFSERVVRFQVSKFFTEIFRKLAPQGHAVLVMKRGDAEQTEVRRLRVIVSSRL